MLKNTRNDVQVKVTDAEVNVEEIKQNVKDWQTAVNNTITEAERLIQEKEDNPGCFKVLRPNCITRYKHSKKAFKLKQDIVLKQDEKFDSVSYPTIPLKKNFDKLRDDVLKLRNARGKVQRKVEEAKNNVEEIEEDVKKWLEDVDSIIVKADDLIKNQSSIGTDRKTRYQKSKAASELMEDKIDPLLQQEVKFDRVSYPTIPLEKNFDKLRDDVSKLKNARLKVQCKITEAKNNVEEITEDVNKWLEDVDSLIIKAEELIQNQSSIGTDCETRYRNSKAASELMVDNIVPLLQQEERFDKVSRPTIHKEIWLRSNEDYLAFESRNSTVKNVWDALQDEEIYMMGVFGMGGLGKTTLVQEIGRKADNEKLFDEIVFVEVTETPATKKIQTVIANKLGLKFKDAMEDESQRASKLYSRMEKRNILLIIDNIWGELDLKIVGIPSLADRGRNKILMTTRNVDVLEKMGSTKNLGMGILNEKEAWSLFKKMAGNVIQTLELNSLPKDVCKECGGLPIVICTIAKALRSRRQKSQWEDALRILRMPSPAKFTRLLEKEYSKIKLSYDYLEGDELKKTFIISSLMENNTSILDLLKNIVGLGILEGANLTIEQARNRLDSVVKELKDSCLLLDGRTEGRFSMRDVVRIVALTCAYTDHHVFTERNDIEKEWKDKDKLRKCKIISLVGNNIITQLWPEALDCPKLEFLRGSFFEIPKEFFTMTPKLKVLNLFRIQQLLPSSLAHLTNLQTLCLDGSSIRDVAIIEKLKELKVLSLQSTYIEELSTQIGQLTGLKILDLSNCWELKVIAPNVISKLSQLEELYIKGCGIQWKVEVLKEVKHLSQLTNLEIYIEDNKMMPRDFFSRELKRFNISIGYQQLGIYGFSRMFEFQYDSAISLEELRILKNVELLRLVKFSDDDNNLKPLFNEKVFFTNLMALELRNISSGRIWDNQFPTLLSSSYQNLTRFILESCGKIKYVFSSSIAKSLQTLKSLEIRDCEVLEEIVAEEEGAKVVNFAFPQVTNLWL
ncbi:probable disease resistance protein At4g27220 [Pistacia vera]|uniref:probable disease resistance protein At4g27220 n=1 Tax=Pistacia vera TaxID=55513 RepID=UPI001262CC1F|nr:probable disease resistance protein At4g27220 [Pistacia vera]